MRSKEVDDAINIVSNVRTGLMNFNELVNGHKDIIDSVEKVLNYISDLEKYKRKHSIVKRHYVSKDEIRDKIKELEDKFDFFAGREHAEWQDGEFDGDVCDDIALQIKVLKELLGE